LPKIVQHLASPLLSALSTTEFSDIISLKGFYFGPYIFLAIFISMGDAHSICCLIGPYSSVVLGTMMDLFFTSTR
jgi:hypothetical protein